VKIASLRLGDLDRMVLEDGRATRLSWWGERLSRLGIAPGASGNLSFRSERGFVITRTGVELNQIEPGDWVEVTELRRRSDESLEVDYFGNYEPSRDAFVHGAVYQQTPAARSIFHLHDQDMLEKADRLGVPSTDRYYPAGTSESVAEIERLLTNLPAVDYFVLIEHGIVGWATDIEAAGHLIDRWHRRAKEAND